LREAESHRLPHSQFLELVLQDELDVRASCQVARRNKAANFRDVRSLEDFDFSFNPSVPRSRIILHNHNPRDYLAALQNSSATSPPPVPSSTDCSITPKSSP